MHRPYPGPATLISQSQAAGLTHRAVARIAGLSPSMVTRLATGQRGRQPSVATMIGLQRAVASITPAPVTTAAPP